MTVGVSPFELFYFKWRFYCNLLCSVAGSFGLIGLLGGLIDRLCSVINWDEGMWEGQKKNFANLAYLSLGVIFSAFSEAFWFQDPLNTLKRRPNGLQKSLESLFALKFQLFPVILVLNPIEYVKNAQITFKCPTHPSACFSLLS